MKKAGIDMTWEDIDADVDAVFLPGKIHGCEWQLYIIYINESANDGNGSFEIDVIDAKKVLQLYEAVGGNSEEFFADMPDWFHGEWGYCDNGMDGFDYLVERYNDADFIVGRDGGLQEEMMFIVNWATEAVKKM